MKLSHSQNCPKIFLPGTSLVWHTHCPQMQSPSPEQMTETLSLRQLPSSSWLLRPCVWHSQFLPV